MKTRVTFTSDAFPSYGNQSEGDNWDSGIYGKRLAEFLRDGLTEQGLVVADIFAEDWGWYVDFKHDGGYPLFIGCGIMDESTNTFLCFIIPDQPEIKKWFKKIDVRPTVERVATTLARVLASHSSVKNIVWEEAD